MRSVRRADSWARHSLPKPSNLRSESSRVGDIDSPVDQKNGRNHRGIPPKTILRSGQSLTDITGQSHYVEEFMGSFGSEELEYL